MRGERSEEEREIEGGKERGREGVRGRREWEYPPPMHVGVICLHKRWAGCIVCVWCASHAGRALRAPCIRAVYGLQSEKLKIDVRNKSENRT